jgi:uncharacterized C2H2 Zn-finger protein
LFDTTNAKCRETDPEIFFPTGFQPQNEIDAVISLCSRCQVFRECLDYALRNDVDGWWAGTTKAERKKMQKARGITPTPILYSTNYWLIGEDAIKKRNEREQKRKVS